ncbi:hypothetical protein CSB45_14555 [candidate division KSB3 bacterium]|uniref:Uncharacterized protein n=1 Tax=candidate division KSB3 bacterium TaxID=2044937 RepID=A0A2G6E0X9_9BACT|nr:MAG: hypothetical protein CSB45_14555 [candidate division KSB3 bacterium]PIE28422.1 MAG: hypothetical protein CSA57_13995 [candidate division KSB3 bacterium]
MRERDKPRPLTTRREKWDHYWYYYKVQTFIGLFGVILILMMVKDFFQREVPDLSWGYQGMTLTEEQQEALIQALLPLIEDANGDGKTLIHLYPVNDPRQMVVMMASGETQIFSLSRENFSNFARNGAFSALDELLVGQDISLFSEVRLIADGEDEAHIYGVPLKKNRFFKNLGLEAEGCYLGLRIPKTSAKDADTIAYTNAWAVAKQLVSAQYF